MSAVVPNDTWWLDFPRYHVDTLGMLRVVFFYCPRCGRPVKEWRMLSSRYYPNTITFLWRHFDRSVGMHSQILEYGELRGSFENFVKERLELYRSGGNEAQ